MAVMRCAGSLLLLEIARFLCEHAGENEDASGASRKQASEVRPGRLTAALLELS